MSNLSTQDLIALQNAYYADPVEFMRSVLADWFTAPLSWVHRGWLAILCAGQTSCLSMES